MRTNQRAFGIAVALCVSGALGVLAGCSSADAPRIVSHRGSGHASSGSAGPSHGQSGSHPSLPTAKDEWGKARKRIATYRSLTVQGADKIANETASATISGDVDGDPQDIVYSALGQGKASMRIMGSAFYLKGDDAYWRHIAENDGKHMGDDPLFVDRWVKGPTSALGGSVTDDFSIKQMLADMPNDLDPKWSTLSDPGARLTKDTIGGRAAYKIEGADHDTTVWISVDGHDDLLELTDRSPGADGFGRASFSQWNAVPTIEAPKGALDLTGAVASAHPKGA